MLTFLQLATHLFLLLFGVQKCEAFNGPYDTHVLDLAQSENANNFFRVPYQSHGGTFATTTRPAKDNKDFKDKTKLSIALMLPQDYIRLRNFNVCINKEMNRINKGNWSFTKRFYMESYTVIIHKNFRDIEETICTLLNTQSSTAIYLNYNDYSKIEATNSRLFLKFASYINMPVMSFIPNAYATNRPRKNEIQLAPTMNHQAEAMMHLLARYEWLKFSIIVTDTAGSREFLRAAEYFQFNLGNNRQFENFFSCVANINKLDFIDFSVH
jgi:hypothetical protein